MSHLKIEVVLKSSLTTDNTIERAEKALEQVEGFSEVEVVGAYDFDPDESSDAG